ncbi:MAG: alginate O-acetyltransferase AlgX-related protein, partial [Desulforhopalus sp.]
ETISKVMKGTDNWYFFTGDSVLEDFTGKRLRSDSEMREWLEKYRDRKRWLAQRQIQYLQIVVPNKMRVYSEFLGEPWVSQRGETRLDQLRARMNDRDKSTFLDLSLPLLGAKNEGTLYFKSDTHWTPYGAYLGYLAIADKIETLFPDSSFKKDFTFSTMATRKCDKKENSCGDLTNMVLDYESFAESFKEVDEFSACSVVDTFEYSFSDLDTSARDPIIIKGCRNKALTALVFRDSFFRALEPFFSENFNKIIYLWKNYDQQNVEQLLTVFKPDIVIVERGERQL